MAVEYVCSICECAPNWHAYFFPCPLLEGEYICCECCLEEVEKEDVIEKFKLVGLDYTREKIDAACKACGKRPVGESND